MNKLIITRGLPGSGKTTLTKQRQQTDPNLWRVNRDDLRAMLRPQWIWGDVKTEDVVSAVQFNMVGLLTGLGFDVIVDDTHLYDDHVEEIRQIAVALEAGFEVIDLRDVPLEECLRRNGLRPNPVPDLAIRRMYHKHIAPPMDVPIPEACTWKEEQ